MTNPRVLRTPQAAIYVGVSQSLLEKMRVAGTGPAFLKLGERAVGYDVEDLDRWLEERKAPSNVASEAQSDGVNSSAQDE